MQHKVNFQAPSCVRVTVPPALLVKWLLMISEGTTNLLEFIRDALVVLLGTFVTAVSLVVVRDILLTRCRRWARDNAPPPPDYLYSGPKKRSVYFSMKTLMWILPSIDTEYHKWREYMTSLNRSMYVRSSEGYLHYDNATGDREYLPVHYPAFLYEDSFNFLINTIYHQGYKNDTFLHEYQRGLFVFDPPLEESKKNAIDYCLHKMGCICNVAWDTHGLFVPAENVEPIRQMLISFAIPFKVIHRVPRVRGIDRARMLMRNRQ